MKAARVLPELLVGFTRGIFDCNGNEPHAAKLIFITFSHTYICACL